MNIPLTDLPIDVQKYLHKYSSGNWKAEYSAANNYNNIVVIPAIKEYKNILRLLDSLPKCDSKYFNETLFLFVINNTISASDETRLDNLNTIQYLKHLISVNKGFDDTSNNILRSGLLIGFIDASTGELALPEKDGGVGLARKIGMDIALTLFNYKSSKKKLLVCLDADCTVDPNYLTQIVDTCRNSNYSAAYVSFEHPMPEDIDSRLAIICYEIFLRYYVLGLMYARSGHAIHTIGSTMICDHESYIKVEGMNKKKAAEDFYFMEKLCKNYRVHKIEGTKVYPSSRGSWRVPFGTGQRVNRHLSNVQNEYLLYSPESFEVLKKWLEVFNSLDKYSTQEYLSKAMSIHPSLYNFLVDNKFEESWNKIVENCKTDAQLAKQKHSWFDGFRTLKLIHYLRDNGLPQVEMYTAAETLLSKFGKGIGFNPTDDFYSNPDKQLPYLERLRELA